MAGSHGIDLSSVDIDQVSEVEFNVLHNHTKLTSDCRLCGKRVQVSKVFNHIFFKHHIKLNIAIDMVRRYGQKELFFSLGYQGAILTTVFGLEPSQPILHLSKILSKIIKTPCLEV